MSERQTTDPDTTMTGQPCQTQPMHRCAPGSTERPRVALREDRAPNGAPGRSTGEESGLLSGNARVPDGAERARQASLCGRARGGARRAIDALKRQTRVERSNVQLGRRRAAPKPRGLPVRCVPAIWVRPARSPSSRVGNGNQPVPVEATMDPSALPYCVMGLGWERQAVVSGQGSGYSSPTYPKGCAWRTPSAFSPRVGASSFQ